MLYTKSFKVVGTFPGLWLTTGSVIYTFKFTLPEGATKSYSLVGSAKLVAVVYMGLATSYALHPL